MMVSVQERTRTIVSSSGDASFDSHAVRGEIPMSVRGLQRERLRARCALRGAQPAPTVGTIVLHPLALNSGSASVPPRRRDSFTNSDRRRRRRRRCTGGAVEQRQPVSLRKLFAAPIGTGLLDGLDINGLRSLAVSLPMRDGSGRGATRNFAPRRRQMIGSLPLACQCRFSRGGPDRNQKSRAPLHPPFCLAVRNSVAVVGGPTDRPTDLACQPDTPLFF